jgi:hypothetical protein
MAIASGLGDISYRFLGSAETAPWAFVLFADLIFLTWGEILSLFPSTCTDSFGAKYATANLSLLHTAKGASASLVPIANFVQSIDRQLAHAVRHHCRDEFRSGRARSPRASAVALWASACACDGICRHPNTYLRSAVARPPPPCSCSLRALGSASRNKRWDRARRSR